MTDTAPSGERFSFRRVFGACFAVLRRRPGPIALAALIFSVVPSLIFGVIRVVYPIDPEDVLAQLRGTPGENLVTTLTNIALSIIVIRIAMADFAGQSARFGKAMEGVSKHFLGAFGMAIVTNIAIGVGLLLLVVPGLILAAMWYVSLPAKVVEDRGVFDAMSRSAELSRNHRGSIIGFMAVWLFAAGGALLLVLVLAGLVIGLTAPESIDPILDLVVLPPLFALIFVFAALSSVSVYAELKRLKGEGLGPDVAAVFD